MAILTPEEEDFLKKSRESVGYQSSIPSTIPSPKFDQPRDQEIGLNDGSSLYSSPQYDQEPPSFDRQSDPPKSHYGWEGIGRESVPGIPQFQPQGFDPVAAGWEEVPRESGWKEAPTQDFDPVKAGWEEVPSDKPEIPSLLESVKSVPGAFARGMSRMVVSDLPTMAGVTADVIPGNDTVAEALYKTGKAGGELVQKYAPERVSNPLLFKDGGERESLLSLYKSGKASGAEVAGALPGAFIESVAENLLPFGVTIKAASLAARPVVSIAAKLAPQFVAKQSAIMATKEATKQAAKQLGKGATKEAVDMLSKSILEKSGMAGADLAQKAYLARKVGQVGTVLGSAAVEGGGAAQELYSEKGIRSNPYSAIPLALASGLIELVGGNYGMLEKFVAPDALRQAKSLMARAATESAEKIPGIATGIARLIKDTITSQGSEALQEGFQELNSLLSIAASDPEFKLFTQENAERIAESMAVGGLLGSMGPIGERAYDATIGKMGQKPDINIFDAMRESQADAPQLTDIEKTDVSGAAQRRLEELMKKEDRTKDENIEISIITNLMGDPRLFRGLGFKWAQQQEPKDLTAPVTDQSQQTQINEVVREATFPAPVPPPTPAPTPTDLTEVPDATQVGETIGEASPPAGTEGQGEVGVRVRDTAEDGMEAPAGTPEGEVRAEGQVTPPPKVDWKKAKDSPIDALFDGNPVRIVGIHSYNEDGIPMLKVEGTAATIPANEVVVVGQAPSAKKYGPKTSAIPSAAPTMAQEGTRPAPPITPIAGTRYAPGTLAAPDASQLPQNLRGAKPRYGIGKSQYELEFESDIDKALFIVSQAKKSKHDAKYRDFLRAQGLSESDIDLGGSGIRAIIKNTVTGKKSGKVTIPKNSWEATKRGAPPAVKPSAPTPSITKEIGSDLRLLDKSEDEIANMSPDLAKELLADPVNQEKIRRAKLSPEFVRLYDAAKEHVYETGKATILDLREQFGLSHAEAKPIMDELVKRGRVSPLNKQFKHEVLKSRKMDQEAASKAEKEARDLEEEEVPSSAPTPEEIAEEEEREWNRQEEARLRREEMRSGRLSYIQQEIVDRGGYDYGRAERTGAFRKSEKTPKPGVWKKGGMSADQMAQNLGLESAEQMEEMIVEELATQKPQYTGGKWEIDPETNKTYTPMYQAAFTKEQEVIGKKSGKPYTLKIEDGVYNREDLVAITAYDSDGKYSGRLSFVKSTPDTWNTVAIKTQIEAESEGLASAMYRMANKYAISQSATLFTSDGFLGKQSGRAVGNKENFKRYEKEGRVERNRNPLQYGKYKFNPDFQASPLPMYQSADKYTVTQEMPEGLSGEQKKWWANPFIWVKGKSNVNGMSPEQMARLAGEDLRSGEIDPRSDIGKKIISQLMEANMGSFVPQMALPREYFKSSGYYTDLSKLLARMGLSKKARESILDRYAARQGSIAREVSGSGGIKVNKPTLRFSYGDTQKIIDEAFSIMRGEEEVSFQSSPVSASEYGQAFGDQATLDGQQQALEEFKQAVAEQTRRGVKRIYGPLTVEQEKQYAELQRIAAQAEIDKLSLSKGPLSIKQTIAYVLSKMLGAENVVFVDGPDTFTGARLGNNVFISNVNNPGILATIFHESIHIARGEAKNSAEAAAIYNKYQDSVIGALKASGEYDKIIDELAITYKKLYNIEDPTNLTDAERERLTEELLAKVGDRAMQSEKFWAYLKDNNVPLYNKFLAVTRKLLSIIQSKIAGLPESDLMKSLNPKNLSDPHDLARFYKEAATMMKEWGEYVSANNVNVGEALKTGEISYSSSYASAEERSLQARIDALVARRDEAIKSGKNFSSFIVKNLGVQITEANQRLRDYKRMAARKMGVQFMATDPNATKDSPLGEAHDTTRSYQGAFPDEVVTEALFNLRKVQRDNASFKGPLTAQTLRFIMPDGTEVHAVGKWEGKTHNQVAGSSDFKFAAMENGVIRANHALGGVEMWSAPNDKSLGRLRNFLNEAGMKIVVDLNRPPTTDKKSRVYSESSVPHTPFSSIEDTFYEIREFYGMPQPKKQGRSISAQWLGADYQLTPEQQQELDAQNQKDLATAREDRDRAIKIATVNSQRRAPISVKVYAYPEGGRRRYIGKRNTEEEATALVNQQRALGVRADVERVYPDLYNPNIEENTGGSREGLLEAAKNRIYRVGNAWVGPDGEGIDDPVRFQASTAGSANVLTPEEGLPARTKEFLKAFTADIPQRDMKRLERVWTLPYWFAKDHPDFGKVFDVQIRRQDNKNALHQFLVSGIGKTKDKDGKPIKHEFLMLPRKDRESLIPLIVESDVENRMMEDDELRARGMNDKQISAYKAWDAAFKRAFDLWLAMADASQYAPYAKKVWFNWNSPSNPMSVNPLFKDDPVVGRIAGNSLLQDVVEGRISLEDALEGYKGTKGYDVPGIPKQYHEEFQKAYEKVKTSSEAISKYREEFDERHFYMPRFRNQGTLLTRVWEGIPYKSNVLEDARTEFDAPSALKKNELQRKHPGKQITQERDLGTPESLFEDLEPEAMERFIQQALADIQSRGEVSESVADNLRDSIFEVIAKELNARGFMQRALHRRGGDQYLTVRTKDGKLVSSEKIVVPPKVNADGTPGEYTDVEYIKAFDLAKDAAVKAIGAKYGASAVSNMIIVSHPRAIKGYETKDGSKIFNDYMNGLAGFLSKKKASTEFFQELAGVGQEKVDGAVKYTAPNVYEYARQYVRDMLRNQTQADVFGGRLRMAAYFYNISGRLAAAAVNLTQNAVAAVPVLQRKVRESRKRGYKGVGAELLLSKAMKDVITKNLSADEVDFLRQVHERGQDTAQYLNEVMGASDSATVGALQSIARAASTPFAYVEEQNRKAAMIAMHRLIMGESNPDSKSAEDVRRQAVDFSNQVHFVMGKANLPEWARRGDPMGIALRAAYTFRGFTHNYIMMQREYWKGGKMDVLAYSLAYMALLGGAASLPFLDDFLELIEGITGKPYRSHIIASAKKIGPWMDQMLIAGIPGLVGLDLSGSMSIGIPFVGETVEDSMYGVIGGMVKKIPRAYGAAKAQDYSRAIEYASPAAIANPMRAWREYNDGITSQYGKPLYDRNKPVKITAPEAVARVAGFRNIRESELSRAQWSAKNAHATMLARKMNIYKTLKMADPKDRRALQMKLVPKFNEQASRTKGLIEKITYQSIKRAMNQHPDKWLVKFENAQQQGVDWNP